MQKLGTVLEMSKEISSYPWLKAKGLISLSLGFLIKARKITQFSSDILCYFKPNKFEIMNQW